MIGVLPIDKPAGPSSHDVVREARRALQMRRIGHTGTLDPFATGLLLLCLGVATRLAEYLTGLDKVYEATARLGIRTDTLDRTGSIVDQSEGWTALSEDAIRVAFEDQVGTIRQTPPVYSAKKIAGRRAYARARAGEAVEPEPVEVTIHALDVTRVDGPTVGFRMRASSGTYVRAVGRDAGERLGVGAHLTELRRTRIGDFTVDEALVPDQLADVAAAQAALLSPLAAMAHMPMLEVSSDERARICHGQRVPTTATDGILAIAHEDRLVAVAEADHGVLRPRKVFAS